MNPIIIVFFMFIIGLALIVWLAHAAGAKVRMPYTKEWWKDWRR